MPYVGERESFVVHRFGGALLPRPGRDLRKASDQHHQPEEDQEHRNQDVPRVARSVVHEPCDARGDEKGAGDGRKGPSAFEGNPS